MIFTVPSQTYTVPSLKYKRSQEPLVISNPIKRANLGRKLGDNTEVPSLLDLSIFKIKKMARMNEANIAAIAASDLPEDIKDKIQAPKLKV